jgi:hypothetical protein
VRPTHWRILVANRPFETPCGAHHRHVNQNNKNNDIEAKSGVDLRFKFLAQKMKEAGESCTTCIDSQNCMLTLSLCSL